MTLGFACTQRGSSRSVKSNFDNAQLSLQVVVPILDWGIKSGLHQSQISDANLVPQRHCQIKFSFSEKATKICAINLMVFDTYLVNVKTIRKIAQILVAFSEKLNFKYVPFLFGSACLFSS